LLPVNLTDHPGYRALIRKKLETTPFDCGRLVILPSFDNERSISIYRSGSKMKGEIYLLSCIEAHNTLWGVSEGGKAPNRGLKVGTRKTDLVIPKITADVLKQALAAMLAETRDLSRQERPKFITMEGSETEFSLPSMNGSVMRGSLGQFQPFGAKVRRLQAVVDKLKAYCDSPRASRPDLLKGIERDSRELLTLCRKAE